MFLHLLAHYSKNSRNFAMNECTHPTVVLKMFEPIDLATNFHLATRCDSSIVKLSGDLQFIRHEHRKVEKTIQDIVSALETVSKNLDMKVTENTWNSYIMCYCQKIIMAYQSA